MSDVYGRWDLVIGTGEDSYPSWVELNEGEGQFVGRVGSARPLHRLQLEEKWVTFSLPRQYESRTTDLVFTGDLEGDELKGTTTLDNGTEVEWLGTRAAELPLRTPNPQPAISLIGDDLSNWHPRSPNWTSNWHLDQGMLVNSAVGSDLVTHEVFQDFHLEAEYKYPVGSNSGIYLRGRYEFQILDDHESGRNGVGNSGAIYGFLAPSVNAVHPAGEWNSVAITLIGRWITVVLNGQTVIDQQEIPGITGGALDSAEHLPGPIFLQGDHGPITFRKLTVSAL